MEESREGPGSISEEAGLLRYGRFFRRDRLDDPGYSETILGYIKDDLANLGREYPEDSQRLGVLRQKLLQDKRPRLTSWEKAYMGEIRQSVSPEEDWDSRLSCLKFYRDRSL